MGDLFGCPCINDSNEIEGNGTGVDSSNNVQDGVSTVEPRVEPGHEMIVHPFSQMGLEDRNDEQLRSEDGAESETGQLEQQVHAQEEVAPALSEDPLDLPLIDLLSENSPLNVQLCLMLNQSNNRVIRNWKHLAHAIGVPPDVSLSFDCDSEHSPTEDLFDYLVTRNPEMTFSQLKAKLKDAGRNDLIGKLAKDGYQDVWKIADNMEFVDLFKDKLDVPQRHMDWRALANKLNIPRKKREKFGKPKLGPTEQLFLHIRISPGLADLTVGKIKKCLSDMGRSDVLNVFERLKLLDNAFAKDEFKSQSPLMDELSGLLDKDGPMKNWRNLAYNLCIPGPTYQDFDTTRVNNRNPTDLLIRWLSANKPDFTVGMMVECLQSIVRNDVVLVLNGPE